MGDIFQHCIMVLRRMGEWSLKSIPATCLGLGWHQVSIGVISHHQANVVLDDKLRLMTVLGEYFNYLV